MSPRPLPVLLLLVLAGCQPAPPDPAPLPAIAAPAEAPVGPPEQGAQAWPRPFFCAPQAPLPDPPPYCTRSIGAVDCWRSPPLTMPARPGLADGRQALTPAQAARRAQCWPGVL